MEVFKLENEICYPRSKYLHNYILDKNIFLRILNIQKIFSYRIASVLFVLCLHYLLFVPTESKGTAEILNKSFIDFKQNLKLQTNPVDNVSWSQPNGAIQTKLDFDLDIDMQNKIIEGYVRFNYKCITSTNFIALDINNLIIEKVLNNKKEEVEYFIYKNDISNTIGDALVIYSEDICKHKKKNKYVDIYYKNKPNSMGIHFSHPETLHDKRYSFLYTHGEAIYGRTYFPSQDTPSLKVNLSARIRINEPYTALFSGKMISNKKIENTNKKEFYYEMNHPIPTYLITFAAGNLVNKIIPNSRCEVYGEEKSLKYVNRSFEFCEKYIKFYEKFRHFFLDKMKFIVVPDDFPFSGMENPYLTIISESVLSEDRSFTSTISHEIAHFWSGNLVTNKNWKSFWLNEGITTYLTRKSFRKIHGEDIFFFEMKNGLFKLDLALDDLKKNPNSDDTQRSLYPKITDDPYISFSRVPYEKGSFFMYYLETLLGEKTMDKILSDYFNKYKFKSLDSDEFIDFLKNKIKFYKKRSAKKIIDTVRWEDWLKGVERLPVDLKFESKKIQKFDKNIESIKSDNYTLEEFLKFLNKLNLQEKSKIFKVLINDFSHLKENLKQMLKELIKHDDIFNKHKTTEADLIILKGFFIEDAGEKISFLKESLVKVPFYKVQHLKKVFNLIKQKNSDKNFLREALNEISNRINPIAYARISELIRGKPKKKQKKGKVYF